jgi:hypothetical protein
MHVTLCDKTERPFDEVYVEKLLKLKNKLLELFQGAEMR